MKNDLRRRGYPSSYSYDKNEKPINDLLMRDYYDVGTKPKAPYPEEVNASRENLPSLLNNIVKAYNNKNGYKTENSPLRFNSQIYRDGNRNPTAYKYGISYNSPNGGNDYLFSKYTGDDRQSFSGAINGLESVLGDNSFSIGRETPLGTWGIGYNNGTIFGSYDTTRGNNYVELLKQLLK